MTWGPELVQINGDLNLMLEGLRDYIYLIEGKKDISEFDPEKSIASLPILLKLLLRILPLLKSISMASYFIFSKFNTL